jgi:hypothetical protein
MQTVPLNQMADTTQDHLAGADAKAGVAFTPGPWEQHCLMVSEAGQTPGRGRDICHCGLGMRHDPHESEANARRIVQCVNAHDDLVEALRDMLNEFASENESAIAKTYGLHAVLPVRRARAALSAATGVSQ